MARYIPKPVAVKDLVAAAFTAQRLNTGMRASDTEWDEASQELRRYDTNKAIVLRVIAGEIASSPADYELAELAKDAILLENTLHLIKYGTVRTGFQANMLTLLAQDMATESAAGLVAYVPQTYNRLKEREIKQETIAELAFSSEYLGKVGEKVAFTLKVMTKRFLEQYNCFSVTGTDDKGNLVQFMTAKEDCTVSGKYTGKIKRVEQSNYHSGAKVTQLNFVKAI